MIRIIDANALISLFEARQALKAEHNCYVPEEIAEELHSNEESERWLNAQPQVSPRLDEAELLSAFARYLNVYPGVSFYSLKGFGDVAVLATLELLVRAAPATPTLSKDVFPWDSIYLVSDDDRLRRFVAKTFGDHVELETLSEFTSRF